MMRQERHPAAWRRSAAAAPLFVLLLLLGCTSDGVRPDASLAALVGNWQATSFVVTEVSDPSVHLDLIQLGATFSLNVQPSGTYTAILVYSGQPDTEIGQVSVAGSSITLKPNTPASSTATTGTYSIDGTQLTIDGDTQFSFTPGVSPVAATAHIVLVKQ